MLRDTNAGHFQEVDYFLSPFHFYVYLICLILNMDKKEVRYYYVHLKNETRRLKMISGSRDEKWGLDPGF